jgi:hypothetical protein
MEVIRHVERQTHFTLASKEQNKRATMRAIWKLEIGLTEKKITNKQIT